VPTQLYYAEGNIEDGAHRETSEDSTRSKTLRTRRSPSHRKWEVSSEPDNGEQPKGTSGKADGRNPEANPDEKSDARVVPVNDWNNGDGLTPPPAEDREGRRAAKSNADHPPAPRTQSRSRASMGLDGVREAARKSRDMRFTALMHHITPDLLTESFNHLKHSAAAGVDGVTWHEYENGLAKRIGALWDAVQSGRYRAQPSRRVFIPKPNGSQRPLGIAALEDKIVQQAVATVLTAIYEADFLGFSYGFRPGRSQHQALDALCVGLIQKRVNWVLDADIKSFFDTIDHGWMIRFLEHRIADRRVLRLMRKWLNAGVIEAGIRTATQVGTPQGAVISPLLANVYLHYVLDLRKHPVSTAGMAISLIWAEPCQQLFRRR
jgi:hypothetical protein